MDIGVHLPQLGRGASREALIEFCSEAERLGVHSGWVSDHIAWPSDIASKYPYTDDGSFPAPNDIAWLDPIGTMFFVAACTERMKLGGTVLILGYRPPMLTAKAMPPMRRPSTVTENASTRLSASCWVSPCATIFQPGTCS